MPDQTADLILAADVGGTNTRLRLVHADSTADVVAEATYGDGLPVVEAAARFAREHANGSNVVAACFGVAGRVVDGDVRMTNRPSETITDEALAAAMDIDKARVRVVNDMVAHLGGVDQCDAITLREGTPDGEVEAVVMPGTGLGVGYATWHAGRREARPSEGGHADFAPPSAEFDALLAWARGGDRVVWETFLSGPGLARLYAFHAGRPCAAWREISPKNVTAALGGAGPLDAATARRATTDFARLAGARLGNLAVELLATRGLYLGGNILGLIHDADPPAFASTVLQDVQDVGPAAVRDSLRDAPIRLIRSPDSGLRGAVVLARQLL